MLIGFVPIALVHVPSLYYGNDVEALTRYVESSIYRIGFYVGGAIVLAWIVWIVVDIVRKRDPIYDRLAGTAVVRT